MKSLLDPKERGKKLKIKKPKIDFNLIELGVYFVCSFKTLKVLVPELVSY